MANMLDAFTAWKNAADTAAAANQPIPRVTLHLISGAVIMDARITDDGTTGDSIAVTDKVGASLTVLKTAVAYMPTTAPTAPLTPTP